MVDRLELVPGDVRGGGNITTTKQDFKMDNNTNVYHTKLTKSNTFVNGKLMTVFGSSKTDGWNVSFDAPRVVCPGDTVTVNFTASHLHEGSSIHDISATLFLRSLDGETVFWEDTYSSYTLPTSFTVTVPEDCDSVCEWFLFISHSVYQNASLHRSVIVSSDLELDLDVFSDKSVVQTGEIANIVGLVTGSSGESVIGVPGQLVNFYEVWTPGLRVSAPVVQSGDTVDIKAQLIDTADGSLVRESGHVVNVYSVTDVPLVPTRLEFSVSKSILSYVDRDFAQMVVDVYDQFGNVLPGETIVFKVNGVVVDTQESKSYPSTHNYMSGGVGDVVLSVECGNLSKSITIEDCLYYNSGTISTTTVIPINNLPTDFEMSWKTRRIDNNSHAYMKFGSSESHVIYGGIITQEGSVGLYRYQNNSNQQGGMITGYAIGSSDTVVTIKHENSVASISFDGHSTSFTNTVLTDRQYIRADIPNSSGVIKELKIKPL